jgi:thiol-disulfide isomerase/thioredoxin
MIKNLAVIIFIFALAANTFSQEVKTINSVDDMKSVFESAKGKVTLLNFWATWCKPCVKEFPELVKLYRTYKEKGFELLFISLDVPEDVEPKLKPFLQKQGVDFTTFYSTFAKPEELMDYIDKNWQGAIPTTYIYDKDGTMKSSILGTKTYEQFEKEIVPLLN